MFYRWLEAKEDSRFTEEIVEVFQFRQDLPEALRLGKPGTFYIKSSRTKESRGRTLWNFTPIGYDPATQTLIHSRGVVSNWWPKSVIERMESKLIPVRMHEYP